MPITKPLAILALATILKIGQPAAALASQEATKVYAPNGRRVAVIKATRFGQKVYGQNGRRIAVIRR